MTHRLRLQARIACVDVEPVAVALAAEIIADLATVTITSADVHDSVDVLAAG